MAEPSRPTISCTHTRHPAIHPTFPPIVVCKLRHHINLHGRCVQTTGFYIPHVGWELIASLGVYVSDRQISVCPICSSIALRFAAAARSTSSALGGSQQSAASVTPRMPRLIWSISTRMGRLAPRQPSEFQAIAMPTRRPPFAVHALSGQAHGRQKI